MADGLEDSSKGSGRGWQWWVLGGIVALVAVLSIVTVFVSHHKHGSNPSSSSSSSGSSPSNSSRAPGSPPSSVDFYPPSHHEDAGVFVAKYADPLKIVLQFFDIQKSGKLPPDNPISWRGDSALRDGVDANMDLTGGLYDAGDYMKFAFPMAFTGTILSWSILEYKPQYSSLHLLESVTGSLKWITDFLIRAHPAPNQLFFQVGSPTIDHSCWERVEGMNDEPRPSYMLNSSRPGSEVAAEAAACLAAASMVFRDLDDLEYSNTLLTHAQQLFDFADGYRGSFSMSFPAEQQYYNSTGYGDELLWAASWMFYATRNIEYLEYATGELAELHGGWGKAPAWFSWDDKIPGVQVLLARHHMFQQHDEGNEMMQQSLQQYKQTADQLVCAFLPQSPTATNNRTRGGMLWVAQWNSVQHAVGSAFLATVYADYLTSSGVKEFRCSGNNFAARDLRAFAASQADYILGENPLSKSYLVGYGNDFPQQLHHRGASIPADATPGCKAGFQWLHSPSPNPNVATGALVGGPFQNDSYMDWRNNAMQNEATTYNSAAFAALLVALYANGTSLPLA